MHTLLAFLLITPAFGSSFSMVDTNPPKAEACPLPGADEQTWDCPWATVGRKIKNVKGGSPKALAILRADLPQWIHSFDLDKTLSGEIFPLWGESINFDENTKTEILPDSLIFALSKLLGTPPPRTVGGKKIMHAGIQHTYGYLFSVEKTPYGYKRERWAKGDIQAGFGLTTALGLKVDQKPTSSLFQEVTYLLAKLSLGDSLVAKAALPKMEGTLPDDVKKFDPSSFERKRVVETVKLGSRTIEIRTDLVKFKRPKSANTHLLIYSVKDTQKANEPRLITAFPVAEGFAASLTAASAMGDQMEVKARFNAFIPHLTPNTDKVVKGKRALVTL